MEFLSNLHPQFVHFPIAIFILYGIAEIAGILLNKEFVSKTAFLLLFVGVLFSIFAVLTGNKAAESANLLSQSGIKIPKDLIESHEQLATIALWYFVGLLVFRTYAVLQKKFTGLLRKSFFLFAVIGCILIYQTGKLGGELVYKHGVGTQLLDPTKTIRETDK